MIETLEGPLSPDERYGDLLSAVQENRIFGDGMDFVRMRPLTPIEQINAEFAENPLGDRELLGAFVLKHFEPLTPLSSRYQKQERTLDEHVRYMLTDVLVCEAKDVQEPFISLPKRFITPDDVRFGNIKFNWDDDPTIDGVLALGEYDLAMDILENKAYLRDTFGFEPNGTLSCFISRSQPMVFANCVSMLADAYLERGGSPADQEYPLIKYLPQMVKEMQWWERGMHYLEQHPNSKAHEHVVRMPEGYMFRYFDLKNTPRPESYWQDVATAKQAERYNKFVDVGKVFLDLRAGAESGFDYSADRWCRDRENLFTIQTTNIVPVDLNSMVVETKSKIAEAYELSMLVPGRSPEYIAMARAEAKRYRSEAKALGTLINKYNWNEDTGLYHDYNFVQHYADDTPIRANQTRAQSLASIFPMLAGIAPEGRRQRIAERIKQDFLLPGGLATTLKNTKQQWDGDISWPLLNRKAQVAFQKYGFDDLARLIRGRFVFATSKIYQETGKVFEKINARTISKGTAGEYDVTGDFAMSLAVVARMRQETFAERELFMADPRRHRRRIPLAIIAASLALEVGLQS